MTNTTMKQAMAALPGIGVSLLPKLMCPACWPAYAGVVSTVGLSFLISAKYLLPLTVVFLAITTVALGFRASRRHGYGPFWLGFLAAAVILIGKFFFDAEQATYAGIGLLVCGFDLERLAALCGCRALLLRSGRREHSFKGT